MHPRSPSPRTLFAVAASFALATTTFAIGPDQPAARAQPAIPLAARPFHPSDVKLLDGPFLHAQEMGRKYLLDLDPDRLLAPCYEAFDLKPKKPRYGGWEARGVSGHALGHWLSGAARLIASTGDPELKKRLDYIVAELAELQKKRPDGYVSGFPHKPFDEIFSGTFEVRGFSLGHHWVPWYTMHKIFAGLLDAHTIAGNAQALDVLRKLGDWAKAGTDKLTDEQFQRMLGCEHGGMNESFAELYALTGDKKYLDLAQRFVHKDILDPLAAGKDQLSGKHANTQIPKLVGAARLYEYTGKPYFRDMASFFWQQVAVKRSYAFGGNSISEHFPRLDAEPLGPNTAETCNTYNMLRLTRDLMTWQPQSRLGDFYERALYNQILASQDPDSGMMTYFVSTKPGHFKVYSTPFESFWCCTGTGMENPARYSDAIYFHREDDLWVNLFIPSELNWAARGLKLRQETTFPETPATKLTLDAAPAGELALHFRVPYWAAGPVVATVNGKELARAEPAPNPSAENRWLTVRRTWARGDVIELALPMNLHLHKAADDPRNVAILYGPIVLAGAMGRANFPASDLFKGQNEPNNLPAPPAPVLVSPESDPNRWLKPVAGKPLTFTTDGTARPKDLELIPFYRLHHQRYTVYFKTFTPDQWAQHEADIRAREEAQRQLDRRTIDQITPGQQQADVDHKFAGERSNSGNTDNRSWRDARDGGWFSYHLKTEDGPLTLRCTYRAGEPGKRNFAVLVNGTKIAQQTLNREPAGKFYDVDYPLPEELTKGKTSIEVKFQADPGAAAGGIFNLRLLRKAP